MVDVALGLPRSSFGASRPSILCSDFLVCDCADSSNPFFFSRQLPLLATILNSCSLCMVFGRRCAHALPISATRWSCTGGRFFCLVQVGSMCSDDPARHPSWRSPMLQLLRCSSRRRRRSRGSMTRGRAGVEAHRFAEAGGARRPCVRSRRGCSAARQSSISRSARS